MLAQVLYITRDLAYGRCGYNPHSLGERGPEG